MSNIKFPFLAFLAGDLERTIKLEVTAYDRNTKLFCCQYFEHGKQKTKFLNKLQIVHKNSKISITSFVDKEESRKKLGGTINEFIESIAKSLTQKNISNF